ncbi:MAG: hypothetical protein AAGH41_09015 [Pseudomonadota bacterium]
MAGYFINMPTLATTQYPPTQDPSEFEDMVLAAVELRFQNKSFQRNGRSGQSQHGVDVYGDDDTGRLTGVQAKNTVGGVSEAVVDAEISKAEKFNPEIQRYILATAAPRDQAIQTYVLTKSKERIRTAKFSVEIMFWDDVCAEFSKDSTQIQRFFPQFFAGSERPGLQHDRSLFAQLQKDLPFDPPIRFLKEQLMTFQWPRKSYDPFDHFLQAWDSPEQEFVDEGLEAKRLALLSAVRLHAESVARNTFPSGNGMTLQGVPYDWEELYPERYDHAVSELHQLADKVVSAYADLIRTCNEEL